MILGFFTLTLGRVKNAIRSMKMRLHLWIINPDVVAKFLERNGFRVSVSLKNRAIFRFYGRKGRWLAKIFRMPLYIKYEYEIVARKK